MEDTGNIGATNVLRTGRKDLALATLVLDGGKGAIAVGIAYYLGWRPEIAAAGLWTGTWNSWAVPTTR